MSDARKLFEEIDKMVTKWFIMLILFIGIWSLAIVANCWETQDKVDQLIRMHQTTTTQVKAGN